MLLEPPKTEIHKEIRIPGAKNKGFLRRVFEIEDKMMMEVQG